MHDDVYSSMYATCFSNKFKPYDDKSLMDVFKNIPSTRKTQRNKMLTGQNHTSADARVKTNSLF